MDEISANIIPVKVSESVTVGAGNLVLLAGPCVIESEALCRDVAGRVKEICVSLDIPFVFKSSFDKANRSSINSFRGPGLEEGLRILEDIKKDFGVPVVTDVHETYQVKAAAEVADILQIPAYLCRQTDLITACCQSGRVTNVKKGQFLAPEQVKHIIGKAREAGGTDKLLLTERGSCFGYNTLVNDFRAIPIMRALGCPVVFDATHSVQEPGAMADKSGGRREFIPCLSKSAIVCGADAMFMEVHPEPEKAMSDGTNMLAMNDLEPLLKQLIKIKEALT